MSRHLDRHVDRPRGRHHQGVARSAPGERPLRPARHRHVGRLEPRHRPRKLETRREVDARDDLRRHTSDRRRHSLSQRRRAHRRRRARVACPILCRVSRHLDRHAGRPRRRHHHRVARTAPLERPLRPARHRHVIRVEPGHRLRKLETRREVVRRADRGRHDDLKRRSGRVPGRRYAHVRGGTRVTCAVRRRVRRHLHRHVPGSCGRHDQGVARTAPLERPLRPARHHHVIRVEPRHRLRKLEARREVVRRVDPGRQDDLQRGSRRVLQRRRAHRRLRARVARAIGRRVRRHLHRHVGRPSGRHDEGVARAAPRERPLRPPRHRHVIRVELRHRLREREARRELGSRDDLGRHADLHRRSGNVPRRRGARRRNRARVARTVRHRVRPHLHRHARNPRGRDHQRVVRTAPGEHPRRPARHCHVIHGEPRHRLRKRETRREVGRPDLGRHCDFERRGGGVPQHRRTHHRDGTRVTCAVRRRGRRHLHRHVGCPCGRYRQGVARVPVTPRKRPRRPPCHRHVLHGEPGHCLRKLEVRREGRRRIDPGRHIDLHRRRGHIPRHRRAHRRGRASIARAVLRRGRGHLHRHVPRPRRHHHQGVARAAPLERPLRPARHRHVIRGEPRHRFRKLETRREVGSRDNLPRHYDLHRRSGDVPRHRRAHRRRRTRDAAAVRRRVRGHLHGHIGRAGRRHDQGVARAAPRERPFHPARHGHIGRLEPRHRLRKLETRREVGR